MNSPSSRTNPHNHNPLPFSPHNIPSPNSSCSSNTNNNNGLIHHIQQLPPLSPTTPKSMPRSESSATYPTTFVQADSSSFKQVVQMLTGSSDTVKQASAIMTPPIITTTKNNVGLSNNHHYMIPPMKNMQQQQQQQPRQSGYKLYQRRNNNFNINPLVPSFPKPYSYPYPSPASGLVSNNHEVALSPSTLDFPSLVLSPVTPLIPDPFIRSGTALSTGYTMYPNVGNKCSYLDLDPMAVAEEKAIQEKRFFLHPSPSTTPRGTEPPRLLPLFPTTSPRAEVVEVFAEMV
ncbi:hypothetical protein Lalb_Chr16g0383851 [Lupinus albus]|uniref:VQ domain-containing protein n=1 Tax=Lupinus albus TaxID=3870 RepID=A0A6A4PBS4_LUPAL|nr:hypothetical protein Lalb_Chr16g0383851 [Lupinus albus]